MVVVVRGANLFVLVSLLPRLPNGRWKTVANMFLGSITRVYASNQKDEHQRYKSIYDANAEEFAMVEQMQRYVSFLSKTLSLICLR
jgi:hypothetical protein